MADTPDPNDRITVRHKTTLAEIEIAREALPFFPDYEAVDAPGHPARSASKSDWVAFATDNGLAADVAEAMTRDQLVEHFVPTSQKES